MSEHSTIAPEINRRRFLTHTAIAGAVAATVAAPVIVEVASASPRERLEAAIEELRSAMKACVSVHAPSSSWSALLIGDRPSGKADIVIATCDNGKIDLLGSQPKGTTIKTYVDDGSPLLADDVTGTTAFADWEKRRAQS